MLGALGLALAAITLTSTTGYGNAGAMAGLSAWVTEQRGGIWLAPHRGTRPDDEHHHGLLAQTDPGATIDAWVAYEGGAAALTSQHSEPVYDLSGWLAYRRREPGFDPSQVIAAGCLREPWIWALGRARYTLPLPGSLATLPGMR